MPRRSDQVRDHYPPLCPPSSFPPITPYLLPPLNPPHKGRLNLIILSAVAAVIRRSLMVAALMGFTGSGVDFGCGLTDSAKMWLSSLIAVDAVSVGDDRQKSRLELDKKREACRRRRRR